jgi:hypothetical protein
VVLATPDDADEFVVVVRDPASGISPVTAETMLAKTPQGSIFPS